jgi:hypothetical protein
MRKQVILALLAVVAAASVAGAQTFSSGSTGADGALTITADTVLPLPANGILNFTTVTVQPGITLTFAKNASNTPVVILATGDVLINGAINVNAGAYNIDRRYETRIPGPGGFAGGGPGAPGAGPGGGSVSDNYLLCMGKWSGPLSLVPIVGGSGGCGGVFGASGGGGGAIVIASSTKITVGGGIEANGAPLGGSGGAIRLVANQVEVTASGHLYARGCWDCGYYTPSNGNAGVIRIEAPTGHTLLAEPTAVIPPPLVGLPNNEFVRGDPPLLSIVSVAGQPVPAGAGARTYVADILLPTTIPDNVPVVVNAANIPVGTEVTLGFFSANQGTVVTGTLAGAFVSSAATLHLTGLNRTAGVVTSFYVTAVFAVPPAPGGAGAPGPDAVANVRLTATLGEPTRYAFLRADGSEIDPARVPAELRARFTR